MHNESNQFRSLQQSETARIAEAMLRGETPKVKAEPVEMNRTEADRLREVQNTYRQMKIEEEKLEEGILKKIKKFFTGYDAAAERKAEEAARAARWAKEDAARDEARAAQDRERTDLEDSERRRQDRIRQAKDDTETFRSSRLAKDDFGNWQSEDDGKLRRVQTRRGKEAERAERRGEEPDGSVWETRGGNFGGMYRGVRRYFSNRDSAKRYAQSGLD